MNPKRNFIRPTVIAILLIISGVMVSANSPFSVDLNTVDTKAFPLVRFKADIRENDVTAQNFHGKNFRITESEKENLSPLVILPPGNVPDKIDLYVLMDQGINADRYRTIIQDNLLALIRTLKAGGVDLQVYFSTVNSQFSDTDVNFSAMEGNEQAVKTAFDNLLFNSTPKKKVYGLTQLYYLATRPARPGAQKVALVINGSQFYDKDKGEETNYGLREAVRVLSEGEFITFIMGYPTRMLQGFGSDVSENNSLGASVAGGYIGHFTTDLTLLYGLLKERDANAYVFQYFSSLKPEEARDAAMNLYIDGFPVKTFSYSDLPDGNPQIIHVPPAEILYGEDYEVKIEVDTHKNFIDAAELNIVNGLNAFDQSIMRHEPHLESGENRVYTSLVPADKLPQDFLSYQIILHSPYYVSEPAESTYTVPVLKYDSEIQLTHTFVNSNAILWKWEGKTVDQGIQYQLWGGDKMIAETTDRSTLVPVEECSRYHVMKVRVLLKNDANHPRAGQWSFFSLPAEAYLGDGGPITESQAIEKFMECIISKPTASSSALIDLLDGYNPNNDINLNKALFYLTKMMGGNASGDLSLSRHPIVYFLMGFISKNEMQTYQYSSTDIDRSMIYKLITNTNQAVQFMTKLTEAIDLMVRKIIGNTTL